MQPARLIPSGPPTGAGRDRGRPRTPARLALDLRWRAGGRATAGHSAEIAREGALLEPDAALGGEPIPNGAYRCRVIKLGAQSEGLLDYVAYPAFACRVSPERELQRFDKLSGSQRYAGLIFPNDALRQLFLGSLVLGDEIRALQYGEDQSRDVAGFVERIGPQRWRLLMPRPHFEFADGRDGTGAGALIALVSWPPQGRVHHLFVKFSDTGSHVGEIDSSRGRAQWTR